jgi:hypothetical protein
MYSPAVVQQEGAHGGACVHAAVRRGHTWRGEGREVGERRAGMQWREGRYAVGRGRGVGGGCGV